MLDKLEPRERLFIFLASGALIVFLCGWFLFFLGSQRTKVHKMVIESHDAVETARRLKVQIDSMAPAKQVEDKNQFMGTISRLLESNNLKIRNMKDEKPQNSGGFVNYPINISINGANLYDLVNFLHTVEYKTPAQIRNLVINKQLSAKETYDVKIVLSISLPREDQ